MLGSKDECASDPDLAHLFKETICPVGPARLFSARAEMPFQNIASKKRGEKLANFTVELPEHLGEKIVSRLQAPV